ncbi:FG-GAP-like repeat-containing protein [Jiangella muralis]|uniref:FG-GAP-like repeat-containing protein n=1 Tax=Jiangella muralis TaxID=702383 RepID=UPI00069E82CF|nr:FG-GAP-like repeat-containing protein [Jiangella muralis]
MPPVRRRTFLAGAAAAAGAAAIPGLTSTAAAVTGPGRITPGQWPLPRADARNTGHQPLPGGLRRQPKVVASAYLGGSTPWVMAAGLDGDGSTSLLFLTAGSVVATGPRLEPRWSAPGLSPADIAGVYDLAGDGGRQVVVIGTTTVAVLDAATGAQLWSHDFGAVVAFDWMSIGPLADGVAGQQIVVWPYLSPVGVAIAFDRGVAEGYELWRTSPDYVEWAYAPELVIGDVDGDGRNELVIAGYGQILAYDGRTGALLDTGSGWRGRVDWISGPDVNGRNYGQVQLIELDGDGRLELVEVCDGVTLHVAAVDSDAAGLSLLWDEFVEFPESGKSLRTTVNGVGDLDGDGRVEIAVSVFNHTGDGRWHVLVVDAIEGFGTVKADLADRYLWGVQDLDGGGASQLLVSVATDQTPPAVADLEVYALDGAGTWAPVWSLAAAQYVMDPHTPVPATLSPHSRSARSEILRAGPLASFVVRAGGELRGFGYAGGAVTQTWTRADDGGVLHRAGDLDGSGTATVLYQRPSGELVAEDAAGAVLGSTRLGALVCDPVVADLDGRGRSSVVVSAFDRIRVLDLRGNTFKERWSVAGRGEYVYLGGLQSATAADLDGDGRAEVVFVDAAGPRSRLRVLDGAGHEVWSHVFADLPAPTFAGPNGVYLWTFGDFTGDGHLDVYVGANKAGYNTEVSRILDGRDGALLATRDNDGPGHAGGQFGPWVGPPAAADLDGDGVDNALFLAADLLYDVNGTDFADPGIVQGHVGLYHTPILVDVDGDGALEVVLAAGFDYLDVVTFASAPAGSTLWRVDTVPGAHLGRQPGIADVDGDGRLELGVLLNDGSFECRDAATGALRWTFDVGAAGSAVTTLDVDRDGRPEFVVGTVDGRVVCLTADGDLPRVKWTVQLGHKLGDVIAADVDGDGRSELLVTADDGYLYVIA